MSPARMLSFRYGISFHCQNILHGWLNGESKMSMNKLYDVVEASDLAALIAEGVMTSSPPARYRFLQASKPLWSLS